MSKIHINSNGEPGKCTAKISCPFGSDETHFDSSEEAQKAYESAQEAMGRSIVHKKALDGAFSSAESIDEARKVANIISNEGYIAVVTKFSKASIAHTAPIDTEDYDYDEDEDDDYEDDHDNTELSEWEEDVRSASWEEVTSEISDELIDEKYYVRAFKNDSELKEFTDSSKGSWYEDSGSSWLDAGDPKDWNENHQSPIDFDSYDQSVTSLHQEIYKPKR